MISTITPRTVGSLQLGAGAFLIGLEVDGATSAAALRAMIADALEDDRRTLGLTTGGGTFRCVPALRSPAEEARRAPDMDALLLDGWTATLSGTMAAVTPEAMAAAIPGARLTRSGRLATLRPAALTRDAFLPTLCWVGDTASGLVLIELTHALNVAGAAFHFVDRGLGTLPFEFRAHHDGPDGDAPCRVVYLE